MRRFLALSVVVITVLAVLVGAGPSPIAADPVVTAGAAPAPTVRAPLAGPLVVLTPFRAPASRYGRGHRGVDLAAAAGTPVLAVLDGTVVYAGRLVDRGVVSIDLAAGLRTSYEPVTAAVSAGQRVAAGSVIGTVEAGHPGCTPAAACLHWGARINGEYVDPMLLLAPLRVRLLPWDG